jgi:seryl-tRNA synthetase
MLNIKQIIKEPKLIEERLKRKDANLTLDPLLKAYEAFCKSKIESEEAVSTLNRLSKEIGEKKRQGIDTTSLMESVIDVKQNAQTLSEKESMKLFFQNFQTSLTTTLKFHPIRKTTSASKHMAKKEYLTSL